MLLSNQPAPEPETSMDLNLRRSSSPFDHHASFVPFPSTNGITPTTTTVTAAVTAQDHVESPRKLPQPTEIKAPKAPTTPLDRGIQRLAKSMGYRFNVANERQAKLVFADALTCIEKLTVGHAVTRRPRAMITRLILDALMKVVPKECLARAAGAHNGGWCDGDIVARAAAEYILDLKEKGAEGGGEAEVKRDGKGRIERRACVKELSGNGPVAVGEALEKIEGWCDGWLERKISDVDWVRMEDCLEIP